MFKYDNHEFSLKNHGRIIRIKNSGNFIATDFGKINPTNNMIFKILGTNFSFGESLYLVVNEQGQVGRVLSKGVRPFSVFFSDELKVGMRVKIPKTKRGQENYYSSIVDKAKETKQKFLYVGGFRKALSGTGKEVVLALVPEVDNGDLFLSSDLEPYIETPEQFQIKNVKAMSSKKNVVEVDVEFFKEAYGAACREWKEKIQNEFPHLFKKRELKDLLKLVKTSPYDSVFISGNYLVVRMPNCNTDWTFTNWQFIKELSEIGGSSFIYPVHNPLHDLIGDDERIIDSENYQLVYIGHWLNETNWIV
jgi:hypothetical protein